MDADPLEQMRADRERHRREEEADRPDWRHDTLDLDPVVDGATAGGHTVTGDVVRERTHGRALHAGRRVLRSAARSARSAPRRVPAGLVVGALLLGGAGVVSAVAAEGPSGWPSGVTAAPSTGSGSGSGSGSEGDGGDGGDRQQPSVVVGDDGGAAPQQEAPQQEAPQQEAPQQPAGPQQGAPQAGAPAAPAAPGQGGPGQTAPGSQARAAGPAGGPGGGPAAGLAGGPAARP